MQLAPNHHLPLWLHTASSSCLKASLYGVLPITSRNKPIGCLSFPCCTLTWYSRNPFLCCLCGACHFQQSFLSYFFFKSARTANFQTSLFLSWVGQHNHRADDKVNHILNIEEPHGARKPVLATPGLQLFPDVWCLACQKGKKLKSKGLPCLLSESKTSKAVHTYFTRRD